MSLDYLLALHGLKLFLKLYHGHGSEDLQASTVDRGIHPNALGHGVFFKRAHEFLNYLNDNSDIDLYGVGILKNDKPLREALFRDLDRCWQVYEGANHPAVTCTLDGNEHKYEHEF